jgi:hypothetical protein
VSRVDIEILEDRANVRVIAVVSCQEMQEFISIVRGSSLISMKPPKVVVWFEATTPNASLLLTRDNLKLRPGDSEGSGLGKGLGL